MVTSGKGGVGKTTTAAAFGTGLALAGKKTVVIDFDVGLRNLDLIMGCERRVVYDLINVINGDAKLNQALIKDKRVDKLYMLPTSQTRDKDALKLEGVERVMNELKENFDYVVCDSPAGIEHGAQTALYYADEAIVVTNPEVSSVRDSDRIVGMLAQQVAPRRAQRGAGQVAAADHALRRRPGRARRDAQGRGRGRDAGGAAARRDPGIRIGAQGVEYRHARSCSTTESPRPARRIGDAVARYLGEQLEFRYRQRARKRLLWLRVRQPAVAEERVSIFQRTFADAGGRLFGFFRTPTPRSADTAKERLQILLALERSGSAWPNFLPQLQEDVMQAIRKYVEIDNDKVSIEVERGPQVSVLDINIELPTPEGAQLQAA